MESPATPAGLSALSFLADLQRAIEQASATDAQSVPLALDQALAEALGLLRTSSAGGGKALLVGNGGSAAIASHIATDLWKCGQLEALAFNDASLLTCVGNDFGYDRLFAEPIRRFARAGDTLIAVSSSGRSPNVLNAVSTAREVGCPIITLSGFDTDNPLRRLGDVNFHVPFHNYGLVEVSHLALLHSLLDAHNGYPVNGAVKP